MKVRPLAVQGDGGEADWLALSRKHAIDVNTADNYLSIFGGKLTDCLNVGEEVAVALKQCGIALPHAQHRWYGEPPDAVRDEFFHQAELVQTNDNDRRARIIQTLYTTPVAALWSQRHRAIGSDPSGSAPSKSYSAL